MLSGEIESGYSVPVEGSPISRVGMVVLEPDR